MTTLSINKTAQLFKRGRNTIKTMLNDGRLSYALDGVSIEFSELLRVFGPVPDHGSDHPIRSTQTMVQTTPLDQPRPSETIDKKDLEIAILQERVKGLEALLTEKEKIVQLLEYKPKKRWFQF
jgi:hypothetical protein